MRDADAERSRANAVAARAEAVAAQLHETQQDLDKARRQIATQQLAARDSVAGQKVEEAQAEIAMLKARVEVTLTGAHNCCALPLCSHSWPLPPILQQELRRTADTAHNEWATERARLQAAASDARLDAQERESVLAAARLDVRQRTDTAEALRAELLAEQRTTARVKKQMSELRTVAAEASQDADTWRSKARQAEASATMQTELVRLQSCRAFAGRDISS